MSGFSDAVNSGTVEWRFGHLMCRHTARGKPLKAEDRQNGGRYHAHRPEKRRHGRKWAAGACPSCSEERKWNCSDELAEATMLTKSGTELIRQQNRARVLEALRRENGQSHTDLGIETGLASATVTAITQELENENVIERTVASPAGGRGRPRILFKQRRSAAYAAFVRISSDVLQYSMVDYSGTLIYRIEENRDNTGQKVEAFAADIRAALGRLAEKSRIPHNGLKAISISSKGLVADDNKTLLWSSVLGSQQIDMRKTLEPDWQGQDHAQSREPAGGQCAARFAEPQGRKARPAAGRLVAWTLDRAWRCACRRI
jgi:DNA-binding Lrp family transcriptional regulator